jgi:GMP synthase-like glutamine amidotransferase
VRVLVLRHVPFEGLGRIARELEARRAVFDYADLYVPGAALPRLSDYRALIILGGPMSVNDSDSWIPDESRLISDAIARGMPILGICLGAQLIAKALGAEVSRNPEKEIGWFDLRLAEEATDDLLFRHFSDRETVFHWHGETFAMPEGATLLASSARCRHQAFRYGRKIYAMQFHLEPTPEMIAEWVLQDENCGDVRELEAPIDPFLHAERLDRLASCVFGAWAASFCDSPHES